MDFFPVPAANDRLFALEQSWNSPAVIQAFAKLKEWVSKGYFNDGFLSLDPNQALPLLFQDKAAMIFQGPWIENENIVSAPQDPNNYVPILAPPDQPPLRVSGFQEHIQFSPNSNPPPQTTPPPFPAFLPPPYYPTLP